MNSPIRMALWISVGIVLAIAIISIIVIFTKIKQKKKEITISQLKIAKDLEGRESERKMIQRKDFGQADINLQNLLKQTINHEIVEFCINSAIRNEFKNIILIGDVEPYEAIVLSNKADASIYVRNKEFDLDSYNKIKNNNNVIKHNLTIIENENFEMQFDSIMCLNSTNGYEYLFLDNEKFLKKGGMFIFANTKSNKKSVKLLIKEINKLNYRYDVLNWYTGFVTIVK